MEGLSDKEESHFDGLAQVHKVPPHRRLVHDMGLALVFKGLDPHHLAFMVHHKGPMVWILDLDPKILKEVVLGLLEAN